MWAPSELPGAHISKHGTHHPKCPQLPSHLHFAPSVTGVFTHTFSFSQSHHPEPPVLISMASYLVPVDGWACFLSFSWQTFLGCFAYLRTSVIKISGDFWSVQHLHSNLGGTGEHHSWVFLSVNMVQLSRFQAFAYFKLWTTWNDSKILKK